MFVHPVIPHRRCDGRKPSPRQQRAAQLVAMIGAGVSASIGAGFLASTHDFTILVCVVVGVAFVVGILLARTIGGRHRV